MRRYAIIRSIGILALAAGLVSGCAPDGRADAGTTPQASPAGGKNEERLWHEASAKAPAPGMPLQPSLAPLIKELKQAVVNISSTTVVKNPAPNRRRQGGDDEEQFFERFFGQQMPEEFRGTSLGSGFIINDEGYVLTNNHVVKDATDIKVKLDDGREFEAKTVGRDPATDVALIKLQKVTSKLPVVGLGDSDALEQGDFVLAIGSPLGFRESATFGIVSAKDRQLTGSPYDDFLQTDAAINQGNSGGPLFNMKGEVIGINTAIISPQIGSGIGFAVPINLAKQVIPQLRKGKVSRGYLGVAVSELTPDLIKGFGLKENAKGALVQSVQPRSPAATAGIRPGDVVFSVNGKPIESASQLTRTVSGVSPGGKATLGILRDGKTRQVQVTVVQRPSEEALARGELSPDQGEDEEQGSPRKEGEEKLGIRVAPLDPQAARELGVPENQGVLVVSVKRSGPAASAGIRRNDVIVEVTEAGHTQAVNKVEQLVTTIDKMKAGEIAVLRIVRGQQAVYVPVKLGGEAK
ncbi:MAG TPA: Do family serine endopeptidase [Anaeromyxobacteraceae bacterium]|nr:Do family serine endopeptidase [Anaeromyxobacteraceae bacterium]